MSIVAPENAGLDELPDPWVLQSHAQLPHQGSKTNSINSNSSSTKATPVPQSPSSISSAATATTPQLQNSCSGLEGNAVVKNENNHFSLRFSQQQIQVASQPPPSHQGVGGGQLKIMNAVAPAVACPPTTAASKKIRRKPENKPQSQINKCKNEKRRREEENVYIEQLGEFLQINKRDTMASCKPDKAAILNEVVKTFRLLLEKEKGDPRERCTKCPPDSTDACTHNPVQQGDVSSTEPPLPESSSNGGQPEISAYFEAVEHYISSSGWVLLEINAEGIIECVSENISELIQFTRQDLHNQSIYTYLHPGDHKILSPILNNMTFSQGWESLEDVDRTGGVPGGGANNDSNNNTLTGDNCFGATTPGGPNTNGSGGGQSLGSNGSGGSANNSTNNNNSVAVVNNNNNNNSTSGTSSAGLSPKRSIRSRIRMLLKNTDQETAEQKQRRPDKYEEVVIIAAPVRDGDECSSVLCLITRPEDENMCDTNTVHSQLQHHHNQLINVQQLPQLMQGNVEQLTLKMTVTGKVLSHDLSTLRDSFKQHLREKPLVSLQELCHFQDMHLLQKQMLEVSQSTEPKQSLYRLRLGAPDVYVHCKSQLKLWQSAEGDFIMAVYTVLHDSDLAQSNLMAGSNNSNSSSSSNSGTSTINGILMSPRTMANNNQGIMGSGPSAMMHTQQQQQQMGGGLPNYFQQQQQNKLMANGAMNNSNNNGNSYGMGGPLMTSVVNGGGSVQQQQQQQQQMNRNPIIKQDPMFMSDIDLEILASDPAFPFDIDFEPSPVSRSSLTPVNPSRPPSVSGLSYSPLPTPLTPYQMHQSNQGGNGGGGGAGDPLQVSPNGGGNGGTGGQTPNTQTSGYGSTAGGSSFSFPGFGDDSQGSSSGKDKAMGRPSPQQQQQQSMETTRLRSLLSTPGGSNAVSPPSASMGAKKGAGGKKGTANDARQANQILKNLLNSDEESKEGGEKGGSSFSGSGGRPQIPQSPNNRRSDNSKLLVQLLNQGEDENNGSRPGSELLKLLESNKDPQKNQPSNTMNQGELMKRLRINMDDKRPAEPEEGPSSKRKDTRTLRERNQMLASLLSNPSNPPVATTQVQRTIIPDIMSSSISMRGQQATGGQQQQQPQGGMSVNSSSGGSLIMSGGSNGSNGVNTNSSSNSNSSNLNNNQKQQIVQQMNQGRSNHHPPQTPQQQQQPLAQQPTGTIHKPSDLYLNQIQMPHQADLNKSQGPAINASQPLQQSLFDSGPLATTTAATPTQPQLHGTSEWDPELSRILNEVIDIVPEPFDLLQADNPAMVVDGVGAATVTVSTTSVPASGAVPASASPVVAAAITTNSMGGAGVSVASSSNLMHSRGPGQLQMQPVLGGPNGPVNTSPVGVGPVSGSPAGPLAALHAGSLNMPGASGHINEQAAISEIEKSLRQYEKGNSFSGSPPAYPIHAPPNKFLSRGGGIVGSNGPLFTNNGMSVAMSNPNNMSIPNSNNNPVQGFPMPPNYAQRPVGVLQQQQQRMAMVGAGQVPRYQNQQRERLLKEQMKQQLVVPSNATSVGLNSADMNSLINNTVAPNVSLQRSNSVARESQLSPGFNSNAFQQMSPGQNRAGPQFSPAQPGAGGGPAQPQGSQQQQQQPQGPPPNYQAFTGNADIQPVSPFGSPEMMNLLNMNKPNGGNGGVLAQQLSPRQPPFSSPQPNQWPPQQQQQQQSISLQQQNPMLQAQLTGNYAGRQFVNAGAGAQRQQQQQQQRSLNSPGMTRQSSFPGPEGGFPGPPSPSQAALGGMPAGNASGMMGNVMFNAQNAQQLQRGVQRHPSIPQGAQHLPGTNNGARDFLRAHVQNRQTGQQQQQQMRPQGSQLMAPGAMMMGAGTNGSGAGTSGGTVVSTGQGGPVTPGGGGMMSPQQQQPGTPNMMSSPDMFFELPTDFYGGGSAAR